ncbi:MAG: tyrosine-type recombinase/integrase [Candidatus Hydrogenedens sp.]|nr:tyrosine-type recombinase/integrase [Candidatus Hydrogenedens sp.]
MATIQTRRTKNGEVSYRVQVRLKGQPNASGTFARKTDAKRWAQQTEAAIREGRYFKTTEAKRHTFGEMIDRYIRDVLPTKNQSSQHTQESQLLWWKEQLGDYTLADVSAPLIAEKRDQLLTEDGPRKRKRSPSTAVRYLAVLSHCYNKAMREWGWVEDSPMRKIDKPKEPRGRTRFLSDDERKALLAACRESKNPHLYDIVVLALSTGMRKGEILGLTWNDVDLDRRVATLRETKNGETRIVPLASLALDRLKERNKIRRIDSPYVFPAPFRRGQKPRPVDMQSAWKAALKRAKVEDFRFHDLRHSCASYLAMGGASPNEIAEVLGHKTLQMVKRYAHLSEAHTSGLVSRMNDAIFSESVSANSNNGAANDHA